MALILTFLGKGGTGRTTLAIAAAKQLAHQGQRVLLVTQDPGPGSGVLLGHALTADPQTVAPRLDAVQFQSAVLLERSWEEVKQLEQQYVRTPFFKDVYGQELGVLPGMDSALALNALREYDASGTYDVILYDGYGDQTTLRMFGMPEILSWYTRRFSAVFTNSDLAKALSPFIQPIASTILSGDWSSNPIDRPVGQVSDFLGKGREAVENPQRVLAYLVTTADPVAIATAHYLWGGAQQIGLTVAGAFLSPMSSTATALTVASDRFAPLPLHRLPERTDPTWDGLMASMPNFTADAQSAPRPVSIDLAAGKVSLYLPGFDKSQVKLTQYGPEVTIEAGDQRHNLRLPATLQGKSVTGARFQEGYLVISF